MGIRALNPRVPPRASESRALSELFSLWAGNRRFVMRSLSITIPTVLLLAQFFTPEHAWAFQSHPAPERLYVHQLAYVFFIISIAFLVYWLQVNIFAALERSKLVRENRRLQKTLKQQESFQDLIGAGETMHEFFQPIPLIAQTDVTVLVTGESGTGKDLAAKAIHRLSARSGGPFLAVNCPNLPENILESELFGYKQGAFTHATLDKKGLLREARGGTIYLDEIGDISPTLQTKLLRVLQEKEIRPLGSTKNIGVDVRLSDS